MRRRRSAPLALLLGGILTGPLAHAHISLEQGGTHLSRYGDRDDAIKEAPCGRAGGARGTNIYTYEAGSTITVSVRESIPHPGYFRIAFDADGDDGFEDPVSIDPIDPGRACPNGPTDQCGASDFFNTPEVLMDNVDPHLPAPGDFFSPKTFTWQVTLPDVACDNCTLQIIQVMEDDLTHGPYDVRPGVGVADVYHQCIDLVLTRTGAPGAGGAAGAGAGGANGGAGAPSDAGGAPSVGGAAASGGLPVSTGGTGPGPGSAGAGGSGTSAGTGGSGMAPTDPGLGGSESDGDSGDDGGCTTASPTGTRAGTSHAVILGALFGLLSMRRRRTR